MSSVFERGRSSYVSTPSAQAGCVCCSCWAVCAALAWQGQLCLHSKCASWLCLLLLLGCVLLLLGRAGYVSTPCARAGKRPDMHTHAHTCTHIHTHTPTHMHAHTYTCTHTHTQTHTHTSRGGAQDPRCLELGQHAAAASHHACPVNTCPLCAKPTVCQAYCVPSLLCAKPTVYQAYCVPSPLCAMPMAAGNKDGRTGHGAVCCRPPRGDCPRV